MINKIIKFSASWCGPCKIMDISLKEFSNKTGIPIDNYDVEQDSELASEYKVRNVPMTLFMYDDVILGKKVGAMTVNQIEQYVEELNNGTEV